ncbi:hypothetical protein WJ970_16945 [Achromobacter xylosoxidans]
MALNRYRLAAMLGLCGCLAGVQAQTILVELEVGESRVLSHPGVRRVAVGNGQVLRAVGTPTGRKSSFS